MKNLIVLSLLIFLFSSCGSTTKNPLTEGKVFELTDSNFSKSVLENKEVSIVYFWATWCGPCRMTGPVLDQLAEEQIGKAGFGKVNVDENPEIAMKYGIRSIPTILFIKEGEVVDKHVGLFTKQMVIKKIKTQS